MGWRQSRSGSHRPLFLARDLPETALHATSRRPTFDPRQRCLTCAVVWSREVLHGGMDRRASMACKGSGELVPLGSMTAAAIILPGRETRLSSARCGAAGEVAAHLLISSAVLHAAPTAAAVLALVDEQPLAAIASLDPL
jgi:hypothetical protein